MSGERPSVRLPSRTVPICVNDPIGLARPRRIAITPAIVVVLTAPMPTSMMPSFPLASAIFTGFFTTAHYIILQSGDRRAGARHACRRAPPPPSITPMPWLRKSTSEPLTVAMTGLKLGDRVLVVGCSDAALIAALAIKSGLTGRACAVDDDEALVARTAAAVERDGRAGRDVHDTADRSAVRGWLRSTSSCCVMCSVPRRRRCARKLSRQRPRVVRPGGRCIVIETSARSGLGGLVSRPVNAEFHAAGGAPPLLAAVGLRGRTDARRAQRHHVHGRGQAERLAGCRLTAP